MGRGGTDLRYPPARIWWERYPHLFQSKSEAGSGHTRFLVCQKKGFPPSAPSVIPRHGPMEAHQISAACTFSSTVLAPSWVLCISSSVVLTSGWAPGTFSSTVPAAGWVPYTFSLVAPTRSRALCTFSSTGQAPSWAFLLPEL